MGRAPTLVLVSGLLIAGMGAVLLAVSDRVEGLVWLAIAILLLGLCLVGVWLRSRLSDKGGNVPAPEELPGRWYLYALLGIGAAIGAWAIYWIKFR
jgi:hypothetical protein